MPDIDRIIEQVKQRVPSAEAAELERSQSGVEGERTWIFGLRGFGNQVSVRSPDGQCPFRIGDAHRVLAASIDEVVLKVVAELKQFERWRRSVRRCTLAIGLGCMGICFLWLSVFTSLSMSASVLLAVPAGTALFLVAVLVAVVLSR